MCGGQQLRRRCMLAMFPTFAYADVAWTAEMLGGCVQQEEPVPDVDVGEPLPCAEPAGTDDAAHVTYLMQLPLGVLQPLQDVFVSTYEIKRAYTAEELRPSARHVLPNTQVATVFDVAVTRGLRVLGIAPAHRRNGKWTTPVAGERVYVGPSKLPLQEASVVCAPAQPRKR